MNPSDLLARRPAEVTTAALALAIVVAYIVGLRDNGVIFALAIVLGGTPAAITWFVNTIRTRR